MKRILLATLLSTGLGLAAFAQEVKETDVPAAVKTSFKTAFPNAKDVDWKMKEGKYKVDFDIDGTDYIAAFGVDGKMISKGMKIRVSELPSAVTNAVKSSYANKDIENVYRVDKDGTVCYLVKLEGNPDTKVLYSADGQVVKEKKDQ
jgi:hypothetical protein